MLRSSTTAVLLTALLCALVPAAAQAAAPEQASLQASFSPNRLGAPTTITLAFELALTGGAAPPPLTAMDLRMPAGMNYTRTTLGLALCKPSVLEEKGIAACPANSHLGYGSAYVEVPFGMGAGREIPEIQAVAAPSKTGNLNVLFYANGEYPVYAQLDFTGEVLPASGLYGSQLATSIPLVTSVPGGPDVSIVRVKTTIGPNHLTYYKRVHGRQVAFKPRGVSVPEHCPRGGFPFEGEFSFQDGNHTTTRTVVPCPSSRS